MIFKTILKDLTKILYDVKLSILNVLSDIEDVAKIHQSETIHREPEDGMFYDAGPDMIDICGKLQVLDQMVVKLTAGGHKTLISSQMTKMLDIYRLVTANTIDHK